LECASPNFFPYIAHNYLFLDLPASGALSVSLNDGIDFLLVENVELVLHSAAVLELQPACGPLDGKTPVTVHGRSFLSSDDMKIDVLLQDDEEKNHDQISVRTINNDECEFKTPSIKAIIDAAKGESLMSSGRTSRIQESAISIKTWPARFRLLIGNDFESNFSDFVYYDIPANLPLCPSCGPVDGGTYIAVEAPFMIPEHSKAKFGIRAVSGRDADDGEDETVYELDAEFISLGDAETCDNFVADSSDSVKAGRMIQCLDEKEWDYAVIAKMPSATEMFAQETEEKQQAALNDSGGETGKDQLEGEHENGDTNEDAVGGAGESVDDGNDEIPEGRSLSKPVPSRRFELLMALDGATFETLGPVFTYYRENEITASFNLSEGTEGDVLEIAVDDASPQTGCHNLKGARNSGQSTFFFLQQSSQTLCIMFTTIS
jgi:hypothetical protein